jgi:hypothetical protein
MSKNRERTQNEGRKRKKEIISIILTQKHVASHLESFIRTPYKGYESKPTE